MQISGGRVFQVEKKTKCQSSEYNGGLAIVEEQKEGM